MSRQPATEEYELLNDAKYRSYVTQIDKALKGFEYTSEWADLVNALGKLNKVLQNNTKYPVIPRKFVVGQRLAQCMHPALPSGVHLKALETYDLIFKCLGTEKLIHELSIYSNGLFPLLGHAAINVKPSLLDIYETHFVPLGERLKPALDGFLVAVLPGLEEGSDYHPTTENLLKKVSDGVGKEYFYGSLWRCNLYNPSVRLPAVSFVTSQFNKKKSLEDQLYIMGTNIEVLVNGVCATLLDPNVLVQRAILDLLLCCFPMHNTQMVKEDMVAIATAAVTVLLRRDVSLNRRLYSWLFGTDLSIGASNLFKSKTTSSSSLASNSSSSSQSRSRQRRRDIYFENYSKDLITEAFVACLKNPSKKASTSYSAWESLGDLWPFRLMICMLDNQEIKAPLISNLSIDIFRALYSENVKNSSPEIKRTSNLLLSNLGIAYSWKKLSEWFLEACQSNLKAAAENQGKRSDNLIGSVNSVGSGSVEIVEVCAIMDFITEATAIDNYPETSAYHLPKVFSELLRNTTENCETFSVEQLRAVVQLSIKMVSKMQPAAEIEASEFKVADSKVLGDIKEVCEVSTPDGDKTPDAESDFGSLKIDSVSVTTESDPTIEVEALVANVQNLFTRFVDSRLLLNSNVLDEAFKRLSLMDESSVSTGCLLIADNDLVPVYNSLCQLLLRMTLVRKPMVTAVDSVSQITFSVGEVGIPNWLKYLLALACYTVEPSVSVSYCSASTYLSLVAIQKATAQGLPLPSLLNVLTPSNSPVLDFSSNHNTEKGSTHNGTHEPLLTSFHLQCVSTETNYYPKVTQILWDNLRDGACELHLETATLLQQVHDLAEDASICESVICASMASSDEAEAYEGRRRFITLYNITRDFKTKPSPFNRREFDRPLFFMLDSLTHKLDSHNSQAVDWIHLCLKTGDVARILEPVLFILLHPDTSRVSVQHVNIHHQSENADSVGKSDEADNAAQAAAEARIYAISSTAGNVVYHVNPKGKARSTSSPIPANKVLSLTSQNPGQKAHRRYTTSKYNAHDYEVPTGYESSLNNRLLTINMLVNPFGSQSSLASEVMETLDTPTVTFAPILDPMKRLDVKKYAKSSDEMRKGLTPSPFAATPTTPTPMTSRFSKMSLEDSDSLSDSEIVFNLVEDLVDIVVDKVEGDIDAHSSTSSSESGTTTRQTISESISIGSWIKPVSVNQLHSHILLYTQVYDSRRTLYALTALWNLILTDPQQVLFSLTTTSISNRLGFRSQELQSLCARHRKSLFGRGFYSDLDTESVTAFRSSSFLEVIVTTCLYYVRSYYPGLPQSRLSEDEVVGNQKVRILSCEILKMIFSELVTTIKRSPMLSCYIHDMLMRCKVQKVVLHCVVSSVYNFQFKSDPNREPSTTNDDMFSDTIVEFNEKISSSFGFQEDMQKSLLKLLEQLMILESKASPSNANGSEKEQPTHNRKQSDSRASRIRFQPQMSSLKYCPNVLIPSQAMFLSAIQTAIQQSYKAHLHSNWLALVESTLPFAGRSLTRLVVCVISQLCHNLEGYSEIIMQNSREKSCYMPPNYLLSLLKSAATLCHYCLLDASNVATPPLSPQPHSTSATSQQSAANPLQVISNFFHVWSNVENLADHNPNQNAPPSAGDPLVSARRTVLSHLPRILAALLDVWKAVSLKGEANNESGWEVMGSSKEVKQKILDFLSPISLIHGTNFMGAVAVVWYDLRGSRKKSGHSIRTVIPLCSKDQSHLVDLIAAIRVLPMDIILKTVQHVLKHPPQTTHARKKRVPLEVCMLQFFLAYIKVFPGSQLLECWKSLLALLKDGLHVSASQPMAQFHLLAILHEFVQAAPLIEDRKDQKDLQDVSQKLVDACTTVAGARLGQTRWLRRNLEVKPGPQKENMVDSDTDGDFGEPPLLQLESKGNHHSHDSNEPGDNTFLAKYSVYALTALAEFVAPVLDVVYISEEKEKVVPLVSNIMYYVTPYLKNHSAQNAPSFRACSHLLASISGYQYSRKAWRKDAFELLLDPTFFQFDPSCFEHWKTIVDHLMTHDKTTFRDFLARMSVTQTGSLKIFSSKDQENEQRAQFAKRLGFILFCSEKDQYQRYMPEIQDKLIEYLRTTNSPLVQSQIMLCFRVLMIRMSHHHLTSLWPFIYTEMFQAFLQLEHEFVSDGTDFKRSHSGSQLQKLVSFDVPWNQSNGNAYHHSEASLHLFLNACKLLDLAITLPAETLPQFQMYQWAFVGETHEVAAPSEEKSILNHINNNANNVEQSPSPTPSRTSTSTSASGQKATANSANTSFEPLVVRIERELRNKVMGQVPPLLPYTEGRPLLTIPSIKSLVELHPFFYTLMKICQRNSTLNHVVNGHEETSVSQETPVEGDPEQDDTEIVSEVNYIDSVVELDFLEELPHN
ncbi:Protein dopey-1 [Halotydeus destructor]|nr:Protein dopey-1 [Halotydeus destructor]